MATGSVEIHSRNASDMIPWITPKLQLTSWLAVAVVTPQVCECRQSLRSSELAVWPASTAASSQSTSQSHAGPSYLKWESKGMYSSLVTQVQALTNSLIDTHQSILEKEFCSLQLTTVPFLHAVNAETRVLLCNLSWFDLGEIVDGAKSGIVCQSHWDAVQSVRVGPHCILF